MTYADKIATTYVQDLFGRFSFETRQAMFAAFMTVQGRGDGFIEVEDIVAGLVHAPSLTAVLEGADTTADELHKAIDLQRIERCGHSTPDVTRPPFRDPASGISALPLSESAIALYDTISNEFDDAAEQSVTPAAVLAVILRIDPSMAEVLRTRGLTHEMFSR